MNAKRLTIIFGVILVGWVGSRLYEQSEMRRISDEITHLASKRMAYNRISAHESKPGLISITGTLPSKEQLNGLVNDVDQIMKRQFLVRPTVSFGAIQFDDSPELTSRP